MTKSEKPKQTSKSNLLRIIDSERADLLFCIIVAVANVNKRSVTIDDLMVYVDASGRVMRPYIRQLEKQNRLKMVYSKNIETDRDVYSWLPYDRALGHDLFVNNMLKCQSCGKPMAITVMKYVLCQKCAMVDLTYGEGRIRPAENPNWERELDLHSIRYTSSLGNVHSVLLER